MQTEIKQKTFAAVLQPSQKITIDVMCVHRQNFFIINRHTGTVPNEKRCLSRRQRDNDMHTAAKYGAGFRSLFLFFFFIVDLIISISVALNEATLYERR